MITPQMKIFIGVESIDFRKGMDGIAQICRVLFNKDPFSGSVFVFRNRACTSVKVLVYDGTGFWLSTKRLSKGKFHWWPHQQELSAHELSVLLFNGSPQYARFQEPWRKVS